MFHVDIDLKAENNNEGWRNEAEMFEYSAEKLVQAYHEATRVHNAPVTAPVANPARLWEAARLYELASVAYAHAQAKTIGHKKSDAYIEMRIECRKLAMETYRLFSLEAKAKGVWGNHRIPAWPEEV